MNWSIEAIGSLLLIGAGLFFMVKDKLPNPFAKKTSPTSRPYAEIETLLSYFQATSNKAGYDMTVGVGKLLFDSIKESPPEN